MRKTLPKRFSSKPTIDSKSCEHSATVGGWLKTVATNLSINHLNRYRARWRFFSEQAEPIEIAVEVERESDRKEALELAIRKLPDRAACTARPIPFSGDELRGDRRETSECRWPR